MGDQYERNSVSFTSKERMQNFRIFCLNISLYI